MWNAGFSNTNQRESPLKFREFICNAVLCELLRQNKCNCATFQVVSSCDFDLPLQGALRNMLFSPMASHRFAIGYFELPFQGDFHKCLFQKLLIVNY